MSTGFTITDLEKSEQTCARHAQDMHDLFRAGANLKKMPEKDLFE